MLKAYALLVGLFGAGIVHIVTILMIPSFAKNEVWDRLAAISAPHQMVRLARGDSVASAVDNFDPDFEVAICRFDLSKGPVRVASSGNPPYWSTSVYDRAGVFAQSLNTTATGGPLDLVILSPDQMTALRDNLPEDLADTYFVEVPLAEGILVLRAFVPDQSWSESVAAFVADTACEPR